jgi:hypothetical protein
MGKGPWSTPIGGLRRDNTTTMDCWGQKPEEIRGGVQNPDWAFRSVRFCQLCLVPALSRWKTKGKSLE